MGVRATFNSFSTAMDRDMSRNFGTECSPKPRDDSLFGESKSDMSQLFQRLNRQACLDYYINLDLEQRSRDKSLRRYREKRQRRSFNRRLYRNKARQTSRSEEISREQEKDFLLSNPLAMDDSILGLLVVDDWKGEQN
uniref:Uncharacterized protein n=1 Tax=Mucochytrium quahogii TaxID=96639 RepID=A0A7S2RMJ5_9STRA|mmetsp:Transcript_5758/g.10100  ORF Transcript_5758/g.10100 Transcript_5758/m.10100 type:complete len:138 (-) Transcript_5758:159-572(-)